MLTANKIADRLRPVLERYPEIEAAFLFGSHAEDRARADSDLDLALVGPREKLESKKLNLIAELARAGFDRIDLVLLDGAGPELRFEAVRPELSGLRQARLRPRELLFTRSA